jgi:hypothetical protein
MVIVSMLGFRRMSCLREGEKEDVRSSSGKDAIGFIIYCAWRFSASTLELRGMVVSKVELPFLLANLVNE